MTWLTTALGGAERSTLELAQGLHKVLGVDVVLVWWGDGNCPKAVDGVRLRPAASATSYEHALFGELTGNPSETLLICTHRTAMVDIPLAASLDVPVISVLRGILVADQRLRTVDSQRRCLVPHRPDELDWDLLARADRWVGVSRASTASLVELAERPLRAVTIYNGIAMSVRRPRSSTPLRRFSVVARTEPWKRIDRVVVAFAGLPEDVARRTVLNIYGTGTALPQLRKMANPLRNVRFWGHMADDQWRAGTDVLVSACDIEGFGRCVIEAGTAGIPQIVPNRGGSSELVVPGLTGLVYAAGGEQGLTSALVEAAGWSENQFEAFGQRAHVHARSYSQTRCFMAYARLALEVCGPSRRLGELASV
jgi:glycosyltransferase involved in cell wall biosynthesis